MLDILNTLLCSPVADRPVFVSRAGTILLSRFRQDVLSCAAALSTLSHREVILFLPDTPYLFYVCLMASLHTGKNVILPAMGLTDLEAQHKDRGTPIITDRPTQFLPALSPLELISHSSADTLQPIGNCSLSFFTSGSTGTPKEIRKSFASLTTEVVRLFQLQEPVLSQSPIMIASVLPHHIYGMLWRFLLPLASGLVQDLDTLFTPEEIQDKQSRFPHIAFVTTPSFMDQISAYSDQYHFTNNCLAIYSSGSLLRKETSLAMKDLFGVAPFEIFGSSETGGVAFRSQDKTDRWHLFPDVTVSTDDETHLIVHSTCCVTSPYIMQDSVILDADNTFLLQGRLDRLVKIAEERVSLPEVEDRLSRWEYVHQAYALPLTRSNRTVLGVALVLTPTGLDTLTRLGKKVFVTALRTYLSDSLTPATLPRIIRFLPTFPRNAQGKILKQTMTAFFHHPVSEPVIRNLTHTAQNLSADFLFLADDVCFRGHFPKYPIVPGVFQVHFAFLMLRLYYGLTPDHYCLQKVKFSNLILPEMLVRFDLTRLSDCKFQFSFTSKDRTFSSGIITWEDTHV